MRITENMKFNSSLNSLFDVQDQYNSLLEKMSSQRRINRPSDDPVGVTRVIDIKQQQAAIVQYRSNVDRCDSWASVTESKLNSANDLITKAKELATAQATATASAGTRKITAEEVKSLLDEMVALANSQFGDRYLFAGTGTDEPFSATEMAAAIGSAQAASGNIFNGTVASGGTYTGERNKTYVVKATGGGALAAVKYVVSADGGKTWGAEQTGLSGAVALGDGVTLTFAEGSEPMAAGDLFYANGTTSGFYRGNGEDLSISVGRSLTLDYNVSGEAAFTDKGQGCADVLKVLNDLKTAMEGNDVEGIKGQIAKLDLAQDNILLNVSKCGTKANRIGIAKANMDELEQRLMTSLSNTEDADVAELATKFAMKEVALQASYAMASKIGQNTILEYLT
jgi:flagellar hook-associated protein 3 FlgL